MPKTYTTKQVANLFGVKRETVSYWMQRDKLKPCGKFGNGLLLFSEKDIIAYLIRIHMGHYKNQGTDVHLVLEKMNLPYEVKLPDTTRFRGANLGKTHGKKPKEERNQIKKNYYQISKDTHELDIVDDAHAKCTDRMDYINSLVKMKLKRKDEI